MTDGQLAVIKTPLARLPLALYLSLYLSVDVLFSPLAGLF